MTEVKTSLTSFDSNVFWVLRVNIRNIKKNFGSLKESLKNLSVNFSAICLSGTWCEWHKESRTRIIFYQAIIVFINIGNITEDEVCVSLWKNRFVAKLDKNCQYTVMPVNRYIVMSFAADSWSERTHVVVINFIAVFSSWNWNRFFKFVTRIWIIPNHLWWKWINKT